MFACNAQFSMHSGRQCAAPDALPDAGPGGAPKGASPGVGGGADSFFSVVLCWQNVKMCGCLLATPSFQCIGGGSVPPPMPGLGGGADPFFCVVLCWQNVKKFVNVCLQRPVFNASGAAVCRP